MSNGQSDLIERLNMVEGKDEPGSTRWYRNPDGPEAAREIASLQADRDDQNRVLKMLVDRNKQLLVEVTALRELIIEVREFAARARGGEPNA